MVIYCNYYLILGNSGKLELILEKYQAFKLLNMVIIIYRLVIYQHCIKIIVIFGKLALIW